MTKTTFIFNSNGTLKMATTNTSGISLNDSDVIIESDIQLDYSKIYRLVDGNIVEEDYEMPQELVTAALWDDKRKIRNKLLQESDWVVTMHREKGTDIPAAWTTYRQALRDITTQTDPNNITWPTEPS